MFLSKLFAFDAIWARQIQLVFVGMALELVVFNDMSIVVPVVRTVAKVTLQIGNAAMQRDAFELPTHACSETCLLLQQVDILRIAAKKLWRQSCKPSMRGCWVTALSKIPELKSCSQ